MELNQQEQQEQHDQINEPSVWDLFIDKLKLWSRAPQDTQARVVTLEPIQSMRFPWLTLAAMLFALLAQLLLEPSPARTPWPGVFFYTIAFGCLLTSILRKEWHMPKHKPAMEPSEDVKIQWAYLIFGVVSGLLAFMLFGSGQFRFFNTLFWVLSIVLVFMGLRETKPAREFQISRKIEQFKTNGWQIKIAQWTIVLAVVIGVILLFNFYRLDSVPPEMVSDQAEKLLDIFDILNGSRSVYFPRNTGREVLHFYFSASYIGLFNLEVSFLNLKVVAVFANLLTLFFIYLLGKEVGDRWVGLAAALFAGIAYWPLLFTRLALRIPYYPLFVAPVMYFIIRGLRRKSINDVIWAGFFLGLGLHGYTPFRIVPIFVVLGILIYALHHHGRNRKLISFYYLAVIVFVSSMIFIPLFRFWLDNPNLFAYRAFSRLTGMEVGFQRPALLIFLENFWKSSVMFFWHNGVIWAHSIPGRPALEVVSGAFYFLGIAGLIIRYFSKRNWIDLFLLVSIPMMMMPSILSLAYPGENPSLNRSAGAVVPVFIVIGLAFTSTMRVLKQRFAGQTGKLAAALVTVGLIFWSGANNHDLVFNQYYTIYRASSWNTSELGRTAALFIESIGSPQTTYVIGYPHWVDSRLVAINAGHPEIDFAVFPEQIPALMADPRAKMFFVNVADQENLTLLSNAFPAGVQWQHESTTPGKNFLVYLVPPSEGVMP